MDTGRMEKSPFSKEEIAKGLLHIGKSQQEVDALVFGLPDTDMSSEELLALLGDQLTEEEMKALLAYLKAATGGRTGGSTGSTTCEKCGATLPGYGKYCGQCGTEVPVTKPTPGLTMLYCVWCREQIPTGSAYCNHCGKSQSSP